MFVTNEKSEKKWKKSCKYSFLMIRLAISLKLKLGKGRYDFIAKCFNLPSESHLSTYGSPSVGAPCGILHDSLSAERDMFESLHGDDVPMDDWRRCGSLAWDSMVIKERLYFRPNSMRIVGFAEDAFDLNIIKEELKMRLNSDEEETENTGPPLAKHFLCFIFTSLEKKGRRTQIVVLRYGVLSLDSSFIHDKILAAASALARFRFIVVVMGFDGASENRTAVKLLCDLSVKDLLSEKIKKFPGTGDILDWIPLNT